MVSCYFIGIDVYLGQYIMFDYREELRCSLRVYPVNSTSTQYIPFGVMDFSDFALGSLYYAGTSELANNSVKYSV